jgi:hypothetical protein
MNERDLLFLAKVRMQDDDCWLWTRAIQNGYGIFWDGTRNVKAHRYGYELWVGPIPSPLTLDHLCRVRHCVNPEHLEPVTMGENNHRSIGYRLRRAECPAGHPYAKYGRDQAGYPACRLCDNRRHREAREVLSWV